MNLVVPLWLLLVVTEFVPKCLCSLCIVVGGMKLVYLLDLYHLCSCCFHLAGIKHVFLL